MDKKIKNHFTMSKTYFYVISHKSQFHEVISWAIFPPFSPHQETVLILAPCRDLGTLKNGEKNQAFCPKIICPLFGNIFN